MIAVAPEIGTAVRTGRLRPLVVADAHDIAHDRDVVAVKREWFEEMLSIVEWVVQAHEDREKYSNLINEVRDVAQDAESIATRLERALP